jgi:hypothetical protein
MNNYFYSQYDNSKNIVQPHLQRVRQRYRGYRDSGKDNLESHQFILDVSILLKKINDFENLMSQMASLTYFHNSASPYFVAATPFFNASYKMYSNPENRVLIEDMLELSSTLNRISNKIKLLENQESQND